MLYWTEYSGHKPDIQGKRKKFDNTIYTFDIESTSYIILDGVVFPAKHYQELTKKEQERCIQGSCMYVWQFSINDTVYYGRTWEEFEKFISRINDYVPEHKILFVHNLAFEFQYLKSYFAFNNVVARISRKVNSCVMSDYNFELRCSYIMSNCRLGLLPKLYNLPVKKMEGDLDYNKIRHSKTILTDEELGYCENDCLVVYWYIKYELQTYETVKNIPLTSTGHVRRELKSLIRNDYAYRRVVGRAINTDPHIFNLLMNQCFSGGYTHASWLYADEVIKNVDSWDFTSSYPFVLTAFRFPSKKFTPCNVKRMEDMIDTYAYLLVVRFKRIRSIKYNTILSSSKCRNIRGAEYDNGRIIKAETLETTITDVDFKILSKFYTFEYEVLECYCSMYRYLPRKFINFVLDKYVMKTEYKGVAGKELEYQKEKSKFNSLYGMAVTCNIKDKVIYNDNSKEWNEEPLSNEDIIKALKDEEKEGFLSESFGVWCTSIARYNLLINVCKLDDYVIYCDTDSIKLKEGYDKQVIYDYNEKVKQRIQKVSKILGIPYEKYAPKDKKGRERLIGLFDSETEFGDYTYLEFKTMGAKKYAVSQLNENGEKELHITVSGVPKCGVAALNGDIRNFKDDLVFTNEVTGKQLLMYCDNQEPIILKDYNGVELEVNDISGCCLLPTTYVLGKAQDYANLLLENHSARAIYKE